MLKLKLMHFIYSRKTEEKKILQIHQMLVKSLIITAAQNINIYIPAHGSSFKYQK